jgi:hypothetical protein
MNDIAVREHFATTGCLQAIDRGLGIEYELGRALDLLGCERWANHFVCRRAGNSTPSHSRRVCGIAPLKVDTIVVIPCLNLLLYRRDLSRTLIQRIMDQGCLDLRFRERTATFFRHS